MIQLLKANGTESRYDLQKIIVSLQRAGASPKIIQEVIQKTENELYNGMTTQQLYKILYENLKQLSHCTAGKYYLKHAIMELGPTGFPFEKFMSYIFQAEGFEVLTNQFLQGHCVKHEIDVIAEKNNTYLIMECKFHSNAGTICDVKNALYVYARFLDIEKKLLKNLDPNQKFHQGWLVTNTRLSKDAEKYGKCVGMGLLSWDYPLGDSLREKIDRRSLYPITCITNLSKDVIQILLQKGVVLCSTINKNPMILKGIGLSEIQKMMILDEVKIICDSND